jgi:8-oxo-dGTP pyrophosphatase MutT (NUDIX family)
MDKPAWKVHSKRVVFDQSPWVKVEYHEVELPDGRVIPDWSWVTTPDYINVVLHTETGQFLCFRQRKYGVPEPMLALVGGYLQPGEPPLAAAQREVREETGYVSEDWVDLGHYLVDPNRGIATGHLYLARQARQACEIDSDDLEEQEILWLSRAELEQALARGEFKILAWAAAVAFALRYLSSLEARS